MSEIKNVGYTWMTKCNQLTPLPFKALRGQVITRLVTLTLTGAIQRVHPRSSAVWISPRPTGSSFLRTCRDCRVVDRIKSQPNSVVDSTPVDVLLRERAELAGCGLGRGWGSRPTVPRGPTQVPARLRLLQPKAVGFFRLGHRVLRTVYRLWSVTACRRNPTADFDRFCLLTVLSQIIFAGFCLANNAVVAVCAAYNENYYVRK